MKKCAVLLVLILTMAMLPAAQAGKNNTVSPAWYYNDPEGTAYPLGTEDPHYSYGQPPACLYQAHTYYDYYDYTPSAKPVPVKYYPREEKIGYLGYRTLRRTSPYMRGTDVKTLQMMLNTLGYFAGRIDGVFGDRTKAAVKAFQRHNGLTADGVVGPATRAKLVSKYNNRKT